MEGHYGNEFKLKIYAQSNKKELITAASNGDVQTPSASL